MRSAERRPALWQWMSHMRLLAMPTMRAARGPPEFPAPPLLM